MNIALTQYFPQIGDSQQHLAFLAASRNAPSYGQILASAARTTSAAASTVIYNPGCSRLIVIIDVTAWTAGGVTPRLVAWQPTAGSYKTPSIQTMRNAASVLSYFFYFGSGFLPASLGANEDHSAQAVPARFQVYFQHASADSITYSADYHLVP